MKRVIIAIPHSHTWMFTQTCVSALLRNPPSLPEDHETEVEIVVVNNSPWSPAIKGITETRLSESVKVFDNYKPDKYHASALDCIIERFEFDYLLAYETDVISLRAGWLDWFFSQLRQEDFGVGHWHHEQFLNPSCTLYRASVLYQMLDWCKANTSELMRWGDNFEQTKQMDHNQFLSMGPFAEKRGWPEGTKLSEQPTGQVKGVGWYEPGQSLYHWAKNNGYGHTVCKTSTTERIQGLPTQTFYGLDWAPDRDLEIYEMFDLGQRGAAYTAHVWGGTRALDILKHPVECGFVKKWTPFWLEREARFWRDSVDKDIQEQTLELIRKHGWHTRGCGTPEVTDRDREAAAFVQSCYANGGVVFE